MLPQARKKPGEMSSFSVSIECLILHIIPKFKLAQVGMTENIIIILFFLDLI